MDAGYLLTREINYIRGPQGQIVVVVQPNQTKLTLMDDVNEEVLYTVCAVLWGLLAFPFAIIGFSLMCVGWVMVGNPVGQVGLIFFILGLVFMFFFTISMCCLGQSNKDRVQKFMHRPGRDDAAEDTQPMVSPTVEEYSGREMTPYQRFMMYRGVQQASSDMNISGQRLTPMDHTSDQRSTSAQDVSWRLQPSIAFSSSQAQPRPISPTAGHPFDGRSSIGPTRSYVNSPRITEYPGIPASSPQPPAYEYPRNPASSPQPPAYVGSLHEYRRSVTGHDYPSPGQLSPQTLQGSLTYPRSQGLLPPLHDGQSPAVRPSGSQTSLDRILGNVMELSSSLDPERNETRASPARAPPFNPSFSGRRSPYENF